MTDYLAEFREFLHSLRPEWDEAELARLRRKYEGDGIIAVMPDVTSDAIVSPNVIPFRRRRPVHEGDAS